MPGFLQSVVYKYFKASGDASYDWAGETIAAAKPARLLDVGCGNGERLFHYLKQAPKEFHGVEGNPTEAARAMDKKIQITAFDLNGKWSYPDNFFDAIHSSQVIEHVHNTRLFLSETFRVLAPGGVTVMTSENLCSFLNLSAMVLGYTPFSLLAVGGWYLGNPLGLHYGKEVHAEVPNVPMDDPAYSGIMGHNRVLSVLQTRDLLVKIGFTDIEVRSIGLMPIPGWLGRPLEKFMIRRGHWLLIKARKPG
ncbi:MAG TPA: class I SAM-dependent methyltransferase [Candidatus Saccharimonadales bacterium]|nr:class I SAM-dependent methyltransferase [Candidatus Saccharimonadales bacterium]